MEWSTAVYVVKHFLCHTFFLAEYYYNYYDCYYYFRVDNKIKNNFKSRKILLKCEESFKRYA